MSGLSYRVDDLVYESARISLLEQRLLGADRFERLLTCGSEEACLRLLTEFGADVRRDPESGAFLREETLSARLRGVCEELFSNVGELPFLTLWLYPYDYNNVKAAIKCRHRGVDPRGMMLDCGVLDPETVMRAAATCDYSELPPLLAEAAAEAAAALATSGDPQEVDLILDRACYRAMHADARACGEEFAVQLMELKTDLANLASCVRLMRMRGKHVRALAQRAFLEGGRISAETLEGWRESGEAELWAQLRKGELSSFAMAAGGEDASAAQIEKAADDCMITAIRRARGASYGAETLIGYLLGSEYEVKNLRILLVGLALSHSAEVLRERMRLSYV